MNAHARADSIIKDILVNHLPRVQEGLERGYVDENQILVMYDHAVRARILREHGAATAGVVKVADRLLADLKNSSEGMDREETMQFEEMEAAVDAAR